MHLKPQPQQSQFARGVAARSMSMSRNYMPLPARYPDSHYPRGFSEAWHAKNYPFGAANLPAAASSTAAGASVGTAIFPGVGTAIGALLGMGVGLFSGKAHYSPWNFLYDDYPQHIYEAENAIVSLRNALARYTGAQQVSPPPMYSKTGGAQYQASMQAIVPQYVPGSQSQIAAYDRKLNEPGGAYESTVKQQLALIPQLQQALQSAQSSGAPLAPSYPAPGSATSVAPYGGPGPALLTAPPLMPQLLPGPSMLPYTPAQSIAPAGYSLSPTYNAPGATGVVTADMFSAMGPYMPYILGGVGLLVILMQGKGGGTKSVYRSRPRRR